MTALSPALERALRTVAAMTAERPSLAYHGVTATSVAWHLYPEATRTRTHQRGPGAYPRNAARLLNRLVDLRLLSDHFDDVIQHRWTMNAAGERWLSDHPEGERA